MSCDRSMSVFWRNLLPLFSGTQFYVHHCVHLIGMIFWFMAPCNLVGGYQNFGGHWNWRQQLCVTLPYFYHTVHHCILQDCTLRSHCFKNLKSGLSFSLSLILKVQTFLLSTWPLGHWPFRCPSWSTVIHLLYQGSLEHQISASIHIQTMLVYHCRVMHK